MTLGGLASIVMFLAFSGWLLVALIRRMRRSSVNGRVWMIFWSMVAFGIGFGIWCGFYCQYSIGTRFRIASFPIPIAFFHFENGQWIDFPVPTFQAYVSAFTNVIIIMTLATLPTWVIMWRYQYAAAQV